MRLIHSPADSATRFTLYADVPEEASCYGFEAGHLVRCVREVDGSLGRAERVAEPMRPHVQAIEALLRSVAEQVAEAARLLAGREEPPAAVVVVCAIGSAEGSRAAAAALSCAGDDEDGAPLFVDLGGPPPTQTLMASRLARSLEERIARRLPSAQVAARGRTCHVAAAADSHGFSVARVAVAEAAGALAVIHIAPDALGALLADLGAPRVTDALLRVDPGEDQVELDEVVRDLLGRGVSVSALNRRLTWVEERRALFGADDGSSVPLAILGNRPRPRPRASRHRSEPQS